MTSVQTSTSFAELALLPSLLSAVDRLGFEQPTPIQAAAIPTLLEGRDMIGGARTGSGKTAAFGLPLLQVLEGRKDHVAGLVLAPTRELAQQVARSLRELGTDTNLRITTLYGGAPYQPQMAALRRGVDIVVGTPGRIIDMLERGALDLGQVQFVVLDEADEMLRMGFVEDVTTLLEATPETRQTALFSATMPAPIRRIAQQHLKNPAWLQVEDEALHVDHIEQSWVMIPERFKLEALERLLAFHDYEAALVFARTRDDCANLADELGRRGLHVDALHGNLNQAARERVLDRLRSGLSKVVIATDVAARGLDVEHISLVINLGFPQDTETYVHRIGRTGRAGREGRAIMIFGPSGRRRLEVLERKLGTEIKMEHIPSDLELFQKRRGLLCDELLEMMEQPLEAEHALLQDLVKRGASAEDVAAAALRAMASQRDLDLSQAPSQEIPTWMRMGQQPTLNKKRERDERPTPDLGPVCEIFLPVGRRQGVTPRDLVGALANETGISGSNIGRITIHDRKSFVSLPEELAEQILGAFKSLQVRGRRVPLKAAFSASPEPQAAPQDAPPQARGQEDHQDLFLPVGSKQKVRAKDIALAVVDALGVEVRQVGEVKVLGNKSFVRMEQRLAQALLTQHASLQVRGRPVDVRLALPQRELKAPPRAKGGPKAAPKAKKKKNHVHMRKP